MAVNLTEEQKQSLEKYRSCLPVYAQKFLKIKEKTGKIIPLTFNRAQEYIHSECEEQLKRFGRVRKIILKGRQQGSSTYVAARFYHKTTWHKGISTQIFSHLSDTTEILYQVVERFYENSPAIKPGIDRLNRRTMKFQDLDSEYRVGTAGSDSIGRGGTVQLFHGSEVAFWEKTDNIDTGILQSVADLKGTEIILESTGNGMTNFFYQKTMQAIKGIGDFELVFVPWFWQEEYQRDLEDDFVLTPEEEGLKELYELTDEQLNWRRHKIIDFGGDQWKFMQEYPSNPQEAFQVSGDSYITSQSVMEARKRKLNIDSYRDAPLVMGVDPGRTTDRTVAAFRKGPKLLKVIVHDPKKDGIMDQVATAGWIANLIDKYEPFQCNIDVGEGRGVVDILHNNGYKRLVNGIYFNSKADDQETYANKRAEMYSRSKLWIECEDGPVQIPDTEEIHVDATAMPKPPPTLNSRIKMPDKSLVIKRCGFSPDIWESVILTFAFLISKAHNLERYKTKTIKKAGGLITMKKKRRTHDANTDMLNEGNIFNRS